MNQSNTPNHIAIIPDGNRRWARKRGFQPWIGHRAGSKVFEDVLQKALEFGIPYLTFWGASWDNLTKRSRQEVDFLCEVFAERFKAIAKDKRVHENKVRIRVLGPWSEILPKQTQEAISRAIDSTREYGDYHLTFLLAYDGRQEIINCVQNILNAQANDLKVDDDLIKQNLWTAELPAVDLVIRTGCQGDPHNSAGFMMWHTAYSQLYFTETLFPDFDADEFEKAVQNFSQRERRIGA